MPACARCANIVRGEPCHLHAIWKSPLNDNALFYTAAWLFLSFNHTVLSKFQPSTFHPRGFTHACALWTYDIPYMQPIRCVCYSMWWQDPQEMFRHISCHNNILPSYSSIALFRVIGVALLGKNLVVNVGRRWRTMMNEAIYYESGCEQWYHRCWLHTIWHNSRDIDTLAFFWCQFGPASIYLYMHIIGWLYEILVKTL